MGQTGYLAFYLMSGVAAALLQVFVLPGSGQPMVGASGAIAGVLGAYLIMYPRARVASLVPILFIFTIIEIPAVVFLVFWFITQLFSGLMTLNGSSGGGIAWWAHIGGFLFGMLAAQFFARRPAYTSYR
jgi:membrane associated rhomboid family serine protease